jgi:hypothetical protein
MTLQNFQPKARITGDKMDLRNYFGRPLLVRVCEFVPDFSSQAFSNPKPVVFVDVVDLASGQIFINALWGGGAVVDNLKEHAGTDAVLPLVANNALGGNGRNYIALAALDDATAAQAGQWYQQNWGVVEQTRQQRMAQAQAAAPVQQAPAQNQFQQAAQAPQQGFVPAAQAPQQNQFQQPAAQAAPVQQGFGQPQQQGGQFQQAMSNTAPGTPGAVGIGNPAMQQQGFAPAQGQQAPAGMFSDQMPPVQQGQGFAQPQQGTDPAAAQQALQQLNGQLGG